MPLIARFWRHGAGIFRVAGALDEEVRGDPGVSDLWVSRGGLFVSARPTTSTTSRLTVAIDAAEQHLGQDQDQQGNKT